MPYHLRPNQVILKDHCKETLRLNKLTNVTDNPRYHHVVSLLHIIRRQLLNNRSYREPYLDILLDIYDLGTPKTKKRIRKTRPTRPTDLDIRQFLYSQWPEIILRSTEMSDTSYNWAFTVGWTLMEGESTIYMSHDFVSHLQRKAVVGRNYGASFDQLNLLFISLIIRAMADRIVMWWSGGCLELPDCLPYSAGLCVEKWFFGGVIQGWWLDGQFGSLRKLGGISLEASACNSIIDQHDAIQILKQFNTYNKQLPLGSMTSLRFPSCHHLDHRTRSKACYLLPEWRRRGSSKRQNSGGLSMAGIMIKY